MIQTGSMNNKRDNNILWQLDKNDLRLRSYSHDIKRQGSASSSSEDWMVEVQANIKKEMLVSC